MSLCRLEKACQIPLPQLSLLLNDVVHGVDVQEC